MNDYENLEKLLDESSMGDYAMYTKEDLVEFAQLAIEEALYVVDMPLIERNEIRKHFGMKVFGIKEEPYPASMIGLVTTKDWTK
jgi:hypothetical protein